METFPQHQQLQKNVLLTICSDRILQDVNFDKYRCAKLVLDCLCSWQDSSMNRSVTEYINYYYNILFSVECQLQYAQSSLLRYLQKRPVSSGLTQVI